MPYNYKGYDEKSNKWIYGEREIIVNPKDLSKQYFIVNENERIEFKKEMMCKITPLTAGPNKEPIYDKDIIIISFQDNPSTAFIVSRGECELHLEYEDVTIYGLFLKGYDDKDYIFSDNVVKNPSMLSIVGNILEPYNK
jgi:hypothetical protein